MYRRNWPTASNDVWPFVAEWIVVFNGEAYEVLFRQNWVGEIFIWLKHEV